VWRRSESKITELLTMVSEKEALPYNKQRARGREKEEKEVVPFRKNKNFFALEQIKTANI